ncbi:MAG: PilZ domain-containing protein [Sphingobium sp.]
MTDDAPSSNRAAKRDSLFLKAELHAEGSGKSIGPVRIRNLSATGLMADCDVRLTDGDRVTLALRGAGDIAASVSWCRDGRVGLVFDDRIDPLAARRPVSSEKAQVAPAPQPFRSLGEAVQPVRFRGTR